MSIHLKVYILLGNFVVKNDRRHFAQSGVGVLITIFCYFCQVSAKKLAFFLRGNVMMKNLQKKLAVV
jgi:hypothetical protein